LIDKLSLLAKFKEKLREPQALEGRRIRESLRGIATKALNESSTIVSWSECSEEIRSSSLYKRKFIS